MPSPAIRCQRHSLFDSFDRVCVCDHVLYYKFVDTVSSKLLAGIFTSVEVNRSNVDRNQFVNRMS